MAITTLDAALAGMQFPQSFAKAVTPTLVAGRPHSLWYLGGQPGAGAAPANTAGGVNLSSSSAVVAGQIPHYDPGSGNSYLAQLAAKATIAGTLLLCDRLQHIAGTSAGAAISPTTTTSQTITSSALPARDRAGSVNGDGILCALEAGSTLGAGSLVPASFLIGYTNQAGASGKTATLIDTYTSAPTQGAFHRIGLQAGDTGISQINSLTLGVSVTSGTIVLVLYRVLAEIPLVAPFVGDSVDALTSGFPQLFNGTCPFLLFIPNTTTATNISGVYSETQG